MVNFAAFSFASSSILVPLEAVQLVVNVVFNKVVNNAPVSCRMVLGVALAVTGTTLAVVFGPNDERCFTISEMEDFWSQVAATPALRSGQTPHGLPITLYRAVPHARSSLLSAAWLQPLWWIYFIATVVFAVLCYAVNLRFQRAQRLGRPLPQSQYVLPVTFALSSALVGGAQMIVHSKVCGH